MTSEKLKKEMSLIDSVIVHSRTVLALKIALNEQRKTLFLITRLPVHILVAEKIKEVIEELDYKLNELEKGISILLKKALKGQRVIVPEKFYFSGSDLKAGYCCLEQVVLVEGEQTKRVCKYLLLSDVSINNFANYKAGMIIDEKTLDQIANNIPSVLGNMESLYKITMNRKCSIVEPF
jgi:hypothetical protein